MELKAVRLRGDRVAGPSRDALADELAAFANARGGTVVLGVDAKSGDVRGIPLDRLDLVETWVREICNDSVTPPLDADILAQVTEALHFVRRNILVRTTKSTGRMERPQYSERAVFEALVNAVAHRDYSMAGARIRLHLFADRLELHVPGALANSLTPESLHLLQASRNELIVSLLARCPAPTGIGRLRLMDRRGDGVPIIRKETHALSGRWPEYDLAGDSALRLVLRAAAE